MMKRIKDGDTTYYYENDILKYEHHLTAESGFESWKEYNQAGDCIRETVKAPEPKTKNVIVEEIARSEVKEFQFRKGDR